MQGCSSEPKRILVADDDEMLARTLGKCLEEAGHAVALARDGKAAMNLVTLEPFDLILSDIRMPEVNGIELLHFVRRTRPTPVVLMTGVSELSAPGGVEDLRLDGFLRKPFGKKELLEALEPILGPRPEADSSPLQRLADDDFCKVSIEDFVAGTCIRFDIFIRVAAGSYVKIAHRESDLSTERIKGYRDKGIRFLFLRKDDFRSYVGFSLTLARAAEGSSIVTKAKKLQLLKHTGEVILERLFFDQVDGEGFAAATGVVESTVSTLTDDQDLFELLTVLNRHDDHIYAHSLGVSMYAVMIARAVRWTSAGTLFKIAVGGLLHDIGLKEIDPGLLSKPRKDLKPAEINRIQSHVTRGMEILSRIPSVPGDIIRIAYQHHERNSGTGYPVGTKQKRIHPLSRLVAVADEFCELTLKGPGSPCLHPQEAIRRMLIAQDGGFDPLFLAALMRLFGMKIPPELFKFQPSKWRQT